MNYEDGSRSKSIQNFGHLHYRVTDNYHAGVLIGRITGLVCPSVRPSVCLSVLYGSSVARNLIWVGINVN